MKAIAEASTIRKIQLLTRVEGDGRVRLCIEDGEVKEIGLDIFEAPRFFEAFLKGRSPYEAPDIGARICGICPVSHQLVAAQALERIFNSPPPAEIDLLRRLLCCAEWIESHALHIFMLNGPDFIGFSSAIEMASQYPDFVRDAFRLKGAGNDLLVALGGRSPHPVSLRVGGMTKAPDPIDLEPLRENLIECLAIARQGASWASSLPIIEFNRDHLYVSVIDHHTYPLGIGDLIAIGDRGNIVPGSFDQHFEEVQVAHSHALHTRHRDGSAYMCGPIARLNNNASKLHPIATETLESMGLVLPVRNPFASIAVRSVELVHAIAEAIDLIEAYKTKPSQTFNDAQAAVGHAWGVTEAPRGLLLHRYSISEKGLIESARIIPPTAQNLAMMEEDMRALAQLYAYDGNEATRYCEMLVRSYDPCISCATH